MTKFKSSNIFESMLNALRGLKLAICSQRNFVIEIFVAFIVVILSVFLKFSLTDTCILIIMIILVLICEMFNSVIEFIIDSVYKNNYSKIAQMAKDMSAGIVLLTSGISVIVGILLFIKYSI